MKITIDTTKDSHTEIKKVVKLLNHLVGEEEIVSNSADMFSSGEAAETVEPQESPVHPDDGSTDDGDQGGLFNMFGDSPETVKADEEELPELKDDEPAEETPEIAEDVDEDSETPEEKVDVEIVPYD